MRTIIAGSRDIRDYNVLLDAVRMAEEERGIVPSVVLSGRQRGVDTLGERWADENGISVEPYAAEWERFGKAAGPIRNALMADNADALIAIPSGGPGTADMIKKARAKGLKVYVHEPARP